MFPELTLTGYPPEDLLARDDFLSDVERACQALCQHAKNISFIVGHPERGDNHQLFNAASLFSDGKCQTTYYKQCLPNYGVFDEKRYFATGNSPCVFELKQTRIGLMICEDLWHDAPMEQCIENGATLVISINASPFHLHKQQKRLDIIQAASKKHHCPIVYVHLIGGQDELVFDGGSLVVDAAGTLCASAPYFKEALLTVDFDTNQQPTCSTDNTANVAVDEAALMYDALVCGVKDYIEKNNFHDVLLGLSGGIDSALTCVIAVDALGADRVSSVMLPSRYTARMSIEDADSLAKQLGITHNIINIEPLFKTALNDLTPFFQGKASDITEENLQSRVRALILMALSNKLNKLILTTGNKSEMAVGYATLYGDMVGAFAPLKDVYKTWVYRLATYRNKISAVIPTRIITREPSAELRDNQADTDTLPPYECLDQILTYYVEQDLSLQEMITLGIDKDIAMRVIQMVDRNEFKRRQAAPGVRVTPRAFGRNRRYPITNKFSPSKVIT